MSKQPGIKKTLTLKKPERLKSRKTIDSLFKKGRSFAVFPLRIYYSLQLETGPGIQAGFGAPAKKFKKAVDRNRIKRLMREGYRLNKLEIEQVAADRRIFIALFIIYTGRELPTQELVSNKITASLKSIISTIHEADPSPA